MLTGKTSVYIDTTKSDDDGDPAKMPSGVDTAGVLTQDDLLDKDSYKAKKKKPSDRSQFGKFIIHFGEYSHIQSTLDISNSDISNSAKFEASL